MLTIQTVSSSDDVRQVAMLAHEIWNQHFVTIIGQKQVDYMLNRFQSPSAIVSQIASGSDYFLVNDVRQPAPVYVGYLGLVADEVRSRMMISKIYIRQENRGNGLGNGLLDFVRQLCHERGFKTIWLTVNRFNDATVSWYKRKGFVISREIKKDIGEGFFMDDYIMELTVD